MARIKPSRKARFMAALSLAGLTQEGYAKSVGVSRVQVNRVLNEKAVSEPLTKKIDAFIEKTEKEAARRYGAFLRDYKASAA